MKAIVYQKYGSPDVLALKEVDKPAPKDNEVLIRNLATTVTAGDCENRGFKIPLWAWLPAGMILGFRKPKRPILGAELAGQIEAVGQAVTRFKPGDPVFAATRLGFGAHAEYVCLPGTDTYPIALKPTNMTFEEAAAVPAAGLNALRLLRKANIQPGQTILINGAGGSIGTFAVQLAKYFGAKVTAVDSTKKLEMLRSIGANKVIDYTREDFNKSDETYDVIFDVVGTSRLSPTVRVLNEHGIYVLAHPGLSHLILGRLYSRRSSKKVITEVVANYTAEQLIFLKELIEADKIKSVIDRCYSFEQIPEAHRYVETGQKKGNVIIVHHP